MTEQLKTMMERAATQEFAAVDLDAITSAGDRTVRRRRAVAGLAAVAAAVVVAGAAILGGGGDDKADVVDQPFPTDLPMWTVGSTLYTPDETYELGVEVQSVSRTSRGVAFVGTDDDVYAFSGGERERIGSATGDFPNLVGDPDGTIVGWVDRSGPEPVFVVYDFATGSRQQFDEHTSAPKKGADSFESAYFFALDGRTAYWLDDRGTVATDLETGEVEVLAKRSEPLFLIAAEDGRTVNWIEDPTGGDLGTDVVDADGAVLLGYRDVPTLGALSPDGRWAAGLETASVWEVDTGEQHVLDIPIERDAIGYDWLSGDTLMLLVESDDDGIDLLRCQVPAGSCEPVISLALGDEPIALPAFGVLPMLTFGVESEDATSDASEASSTERPE